MFEGGDFCFSHTRPKDAWVKLAFAAARKGEAEKTLRALGKAADLG